MEKVSSLTGFNLKVGQPGLYDNSGIGYLIPGCRNSKPGIAGSQTAYCNKNISCVLLFKCTINNTYFLSHFAGSCRIESCRFNIDNINEIIIFPITHRFPGVNKCFLNLTLININIIEFRTLNYRTNLQQTEFRKFFRRPI